ncbi:MAG TPA: hypothetical protein VFI31_21235, partial [Pirellulales bacterium]|nr:hypothetical protein [Pirellulales bacterium]
LDGVERLHAKVRHVYRLFGNGDKLGLQISPGGHKDIQELQVAAFRWFNRILKGDEQSLAENTGATYFTPEELRVFRDGLPADQINTRIHEEFVPLAAPPCVPESQDEWATLRDGWMAALKNKSFRGWPSEAGPLNVSQVGARAQNGCVARVYDFDSQPCVRLRMFLCHQAALEDVQQVRLSIGGDDPVGQQATARLRAILANTADDLGLPSVSGDGTPGDLPEGVAEAVFFPRGVGPAAWDASEQKQIQNRRRFMLLGQTLAGMQTWDVRRALQAIRVLPGVDAEAKLNVAASGDMTVPLLYATLFEPPPAAMTLFNPPATHADGPDLLNVLRYLDLPQTMAMAAERGVTINVTAPTGDAWEYPEAVIERLKWPNASLSVQK